MANTGNGATLTFSTTSIVFDIVDIDLGTLSVEKLETSLLSDTGFKKYIFADLQEPPEVTFTVRFKATADLPTLGGAAETATVTFSKDVAASAAAANWAGTGAFINIDLPTLANNTVSDGTITFAFDGTTGPTFTKEA